MIRGHTTLPLLNVRDGNSLTQLCPSAVLECMTNGLVSAFLNFLTFQSPIKIIVFQYSRLLTCPFYSIPMNLNPSLKSSSSKKALLIETLLLQIYPLQTSILSIFIMIPLLYIILTFFWIQTKFLGLPLSSSSQLHPLHIPDAPPGSVLPRPELCPLHSCSLTAIPSPQLYLPQYYQSYKTWLKGLFSRKYF